jgi:hypothetical protein
MKILTTERQLRYTIETGKKLYASLPDDLVLPETMKAKATCQSSQPGGKRVTRGIVRDRRSLNPDRK